MTSGERLTLKQAAEYLLISEDHLRKKLAASKRAVARGEPAIIEYQQTSKKGRIVFTVVALENYLNKGVVCPAPLNKKPRKAAGLVLSGGLPDWAKQV